MSARVSPDDVDPLDYYAILGVSPRSTMDEIHRAYRREAKRWHPDRNGAPDASERMAKVNEAYRVLGDPVSRLKYDRDAEAQAIPRPVVSPPAVDFGTLRPGARVARTVVVANAGAPCRTVRVEPEFGSWFRLAGARGGASPGIVAELDFEAFADPTAGLSTGRQDVSVKILLDDQAAEITLRATIAGAGRVKSGGSPTRPTSSPAPTGSAAVGAVASRYVEKMPLWERLARAAVCGAVAPALLLWAAFENPEAAVGLVLLAVALASLTVWAAVRTSLWRSVGTVPLAMQWIAAAILWLGKAFVVVFVAGIVLALAFVALICWIIAAIFDPDS